MIFNLMIIALSLLLAVVPAVIAGVFGGMLLQTFGVPYSYGYWIAAVIGYIGSLIAFLRHFINPEPSRVGVHGFLPGFLLGRLLK